MNHYLPERECLNNHNIHHWVQQNPRAKMENSFQRYFRINVQAGVVGDKTNISNVQRKVKWGTPFTFYYTQLASPSRLTLY